MASSEKQIAANRINALKSHGPTNTAATRTNATTHGLLAAGITELDDAEGYRVIVQNLEQETNPVGTIETFLIESIAMGMVRLRRARRLEAYHINGALDLPTHKAGAQISSMHRPQIDPGLPARMRLDHIFPQLKLFERYGTTIESGLFRNLHELERRMRIRHGEQLPAPAALDVSVHQETGIEPSIIPSPREETLGDTEDTAINRVSFPGPETEPRDDQEIKD